MEEMISDDEDAKQMTEEALRQQKKHLQELAMDDYLDDEMMEDWQKKAIHMIIKTHCHQPAAATTTTYH